MTRKDYRTIAEAVSRAYRQVGSEEDLYVSGWEDALEEVVRNLSLELKRQNGNFHPPTFVEACFDREGVGR